MLVQVLQINIQLWRRHAPTILAELGETFSIAVADRPQRLRHTSVTEKDYKSERAFSAASHVMADLWTTLDPQHLDELLLLRSQFETKQCWWMNYMNNSPSDV